MKKLLLIFVLILFLVQAGAIKAQIYTPPDSCLRLVYPDEPNTRYSNPDSVKVDSCLDSPTFNKWYAKKNYTINFKDSIYIFELKPLPIDTVITWTGIDTSYHDFRNSFKMLEQVFGKFIIKRYPYYTDDKAFLIKPIVNLEFKNYYLKDSVINSILNIDGIKLCYLLREPNISSVSEDNQNIKNIILSPNPVSDYLDISLPTELPHGKIEMFSIEGIKIFETEAVNSIDVRALSPGVYFVRFGGRVGKFVKM